MALENKLAINNSAELARVEEKISKTKAIKLYENNIVEDFEIGKFSGLAKIHKFLFEELYGFAGKICGNECRASLLGREMGEVHAYG